MLPVRCRTNRPLISRVRYPATYIRPCFHLMTWQRQSGGALVGPQSSCRATRNGANNVHGLRDAWSLGGLGDIFSAAHARHARTTNGARHVAAAWEQVSLVLGSGLLDVGPHLGHQLGRRLHPVLPGMFGSLPKHILLRFPTDDVPAPRCRVHLATVDELWHLQTSSKLSLAPSTRLNYRHVKYRLTRSHPEFQQQSSLLAQDATILSSRSANRLPQCAQRRTAIGYSVTRAAARCYSGSPLPVRRPR
jgi:hypothetical protein